MVTASDIDTSAGDELAGAIVRISDNFLRETSTTSGHNVSQDFLTINNLTSGTIAGSGIAFAYDSTTGVMTLSGPGTVVEYQAALELVQFHTSGDNPTNDGTNLVRTVSASVFDGLLYSDEISATINVTGINDAPVNTMGLNNAGNEDSGIAVTGFAVADADASPSDEDVTVTLNVTNGTLTIGSIGGGIMLADVTGNGTATVTITATQNEINTTFAGANGVIFNPAAHYNGVATLTMTTNDLGQNGNDPGNSGTGTTEEDLDVKSILITEVNDAPTISGDGTESAAAIFEDIPSAAGQTIASLFGGQFSDVLDQQFVTGTNPTGSVSDTFAGIAITGNGSAAATGQWQYFNGSIWTDMGAASADAAITLNSATAIRFNPAFNFNGAAPTLTARLIESGGAAIVGGGTVDFNPMPPTSGAGSVYSAGTVLLSQTIISVNDAPLVALADNSVSGTEDSDIVFGAASSNAISVSDVDHPTLTVQVTAANGTLTLSGTTGLSVTGNGTGTVQLTGSTADINAALEGLTYRGNPNFDGSDTVTIVAGDGIASNSDSIAITIADDGILNGDFSDNVINGTPQRDVFHLQQGGNDIANGLAGNDTFYLGAAYSSADEVNAGDGNDSIILQGDYGGGVTVGTIAGLESISLAPGNITSFGDTANNLYDYDLTTSDANVAAGTVLKINGFLLRTGEDFTFDGSAETDGTFTLFAGFGTETLIGGAKNDFFLFGQDGRFAAGDTVVGGAGYDSFYLRGDYVLDFNAPAIATAFAEIESVTLASALDTQFFGGGDSEFDYSITWNNALLASGQTMTINGSRLLSNESMTFIGTSELGGHFRIFAGAGNDDLRGGTGNDLFRGGGGIDNMYGGGGNDVFRYDDVLDSISSARDHILDFSLGDRIDLSRIDAKSGTAANDAFTFIGSGPFAGTGAASAGQLRAEFLGGLIWLVQGDTNGDGVSDLEFFVTDTDSDPITTIDFVL